MEVGGRGTHRQPWSRSQVGEAGAGAGASRRREETRAGGGGAGATEGYRARLRALKDKAATVAAGAIKTVAETAYASASAEEQV